METQQLHRLFLECTALVIDTRKIIPGALFVAIKGDRFDANTFAAEALSKGASYVIIDNPKYYIDNRTIVVDDSLIALQELAKYHRHHLAIPIVALTGSNGKTTSKELINVVLSKKYRTGATIGNLNNHIGVPLTLLSFNSQTQIGIVEMGANHLREIAFLCEIANPDFGYITNFGKAHLEGFGGVEGVIKGKSEMYDYLKENAKTAFVNLDDGIQLDKTTAIKRFTFGTIQSSDIYIESVTANPFVEVTYGGLTIKSQMIGRYNANNINAAIAIGKYFEVPTVEIREAIENYIPENNRSQMIRQGNKEIILDAYNANPSSMAVAIENFIHLENNKKVLFLGDMFELGSESSAEHLNVVRLVAASPVVECHFVGTDFYSVKSENPNLHFHQSYEQMAKYIGRRDFSGYLILIKGSRAMALERVLELL